MFIVCSSNFQVDYDEIEVENSTVYTSAYEVLSESLISIYTIIMLCRSDTQPRSLSNLLCELIYE